MSERIREKIEDAAWHALTALQYNDTERARAMLYSILDALEREEDRIKIMKAG